MTEPLFIYVAGPYKPITDDIHDAARIAHQNTRKAILIGNALIERGHYVFIPHLTHYLHLEMVSKSLPSEFWYKYDLAWLAKCNALYYIAKSKGADIELRWARKHMLKIFHHLDEVPRVK